MKLRALLAALTAAFVLMLGGPVMAAEPYPSKPIKLIVPYPPGGGIDPTARIFAQALSAELGQPIVVQNTGGASGQIGTELAAKSAPDGYTLLFASAAPNAILPAALSKLPYSPKDFAPISFIASAAYVLVTNPKVPADNIEQLLQVIRDQPNVVSNFASSGQLSGPHLAGELFKLLSKGQMMHIPYRGNGPAVAAVLSGEVPMTFASAPAVMGHAKAGKLKAMGISASKRSATLPELPALGEQLPGLEVRQWYGLMAPAGTSREIVEQLHKATVKVVSAEQVRNQFNSHGVEGNTMDPAEFGRFVDADIVKYRNLIRQSNIPLE